MRNTLAEAFGERKRRNVSLRFLVDMTACEAFGTRRSRLPRSASRDLMFLCVSGLGSHVESLICADRGLSGMDSQLAATYGVVRSRASQSEDLLAWQRAWLKPRAQACPVPGRQIPSGVFERYRAPICLSGLYMTRIHVPGRLMGPGLGSIPEPGISATEVTDEGVRSHVMQLLQERLPTVGSAAPATLRSCGQMVTYLQLDASGHDSSHGASCVLEIAGSP
jgi:uncharacterized protein YecT (DUF1311 family)